MFEDPMWAGFLVDDAGTEGSAAAKPAADYDKLGDVAAMAIFETSYASLDGAVLVFYHSLLDGLVFDCCRVTALHAPRDWEEDLKSARIQLLDAKGKSYDQLLRVRLDERLKTLERESLLIKSDRLHARCNPPSGWSPMNGYAYEREMVKRFDDQRHEIVHGRATGKPLTLFPVSDDNLYYILRTGVYFLGLINFKYGLNIDTEALQTKDFLK
jgi:hypothetical protein